MLGSTSWTPSSCSGHTQLTKATGMLSAEWWVCQQEWDPWISDCCLPSGKGKLRTTGQREGETHRLLAQKQGVAHLRGKDSKSQVPHPLPLPSGREQWAVTTQEGSGRRDQGPWTTHVWRETHTSPKAQIPNNNWPKIHLRQIWITFNPLDLKW